MGVSCDIALHFIGFTCPFFSAFVFVWDFVQEEEVATEYGDRHVFDIGFLVYVFLFFIYELYFLVLRSLLLELGVEFRQVHLSKIELALLLRVQLNWHAGLVISIDFLFRLHLL